MRLPLLIVTMACWIISSNRGNADDAQPSPAASAKLVRLEIVMADVSGGAAAQAEMTSDRIDELQKQGKLVTITRIRLTTLENAPAMVQFGERAPIRTARAFSGRGGGGGFGQESFSYENIGTMVQLTPRLEADGSVLVEFQAEQSRLVPAAPAAEPSEGASAALDLPKTTTISTKTMLRIPPGQTVVAAGKGTSADNATTETWILVSAETE